MKISRLIIQTFLFILIIFNTPTSYAHNDPEAHAQTTNQAEFIFGSNKSPVPAGENFEVNINLDSHATLVNAVDLKFEYPSQKIRLINLDTEMSDFEIKADEGSELGKISIVRGTIEPKSGISKIARAQFTALKQIDLNEFSYSEESLVMSVDNENILKGSQVKTTNVNDVNTVLNENNSQSFWEKIKDVNNAFWEKITEFIRNIFSKNNPT